MQYARRFVFKAPKLNVMNAEENSQYEGMQENMSPKSTRGCT